MADVIQATSDLLDKIDEQLDGVISYMDNLTDLINAEIEAIVARENVLRNEISKIIAEIEVQ